MARGGPRPGSGRKKGSGNRPNILEYWNGAQYSEKVMEYFEFITKRYKKSVKIALWVGDQVSGKAVQAVELGGPDGGDITIKLVNYADVTRNG